MGAVAPYRWSDSLRWLACSEGWRISCHSVCICQMNRLKSGNGCGHDDSTVNMDVGIVIRPLDSNMYVDAAYCY